MKIEALPLYFLKKYQVLFFTWDTSLQAAIRLPHFLFVPTKFNKVHFLLQKAY